MPARRLFRRWWGAALIALVPQLVSAQSIQINYYPLKDRYFVQTGASVLSEHHARFSIAATTTVSFFQPPLFPTGSWQIGLTVYPLAASNIAYERSFGTTAEMERTFPAVSAVVTVKNVGVLSFTTAPSIEIPAASAPPEPPITNFDALQNWDGGPLTIIYKLPPLSGTSSTPPVPYSYNLNIWRASDVELNDPRLLWTTTVSGTGSVAPTGVNAEPGETLYGELQLPQTYLQNTSRPPAWVRFPIHRRALSPPIILTHPKAQSLSIGETLTLSVSATGENLAYQWRKDGQDIAGASTASFELKPVQASDAGSYSVRVSNGGGSVVSDSANIIVSARVAAPAIAAAPAAVTVSAGAKATLSVTASGTAPFTYQWLRNGTPIAGASQASLTVERARPSDSGQYSVTVTNSAGSITSSAAELRVNRVSRISNLSILTSLASASDNFTLGFVLGGDLSSETGGAKPVLIRAVGPSLAPLGVQGTLDDPKLELFAGSSLTIANDNWGGDAGLSTAFTAAGAFGYTSATSRDAAVSTRVGTSNNSIRISGTGSGVVLAELYDGTPAEDFGLASPRFANVSVLKQIGAGLTAGFVIDGAEPLRVLIRAVGPTLGGFGVSGTLPDPKLDLFQSGNPTAIASNDNWGAAANATQIASAAASVGAFALASESKDAVLLATLAPGNYTVQVSGVGNATGTALVEVYEVP